jgi:hypothetical protein
MRQSDVCLKKTLEMVNEMLYLADEGDAVREDPSCGVLYGIIRDAAYRIRKVAKAEKEAHIQKGWWEQEAENG